MFKLFENYNNDFKGISIEKRLINLGNVDYINKLKFIKIDYQYDDLYVLAFKKEIPLKQIEYFTLLFNDMLSNNKGITLSDLIKNYGDLFDAFKTKNSQNQIIGLLSELIFILKCKTNEIDILKYYQVQNDKFDFSLPDNRYLEIKHVSELDKTITISESQLSKLNDNDFLIGIHLFRDSKYGVNIFAILDKINFSSEQKNYINSRIEEIENKEELENTKINIEKCDFKIIERKCLPNIYKDFSNIILDATYKIVSIALNRDNQEFFNIVKRSING